MTVQGPVKEQQPDGMSHRGGGGANGLPRLAQWEGGALAFETEEPRRPPLPGLPVQVVVGRFARKAGEPCPLGVPGARTETVDTRAVGRQLWWGIRLSARALIRAGKGVALDGAQKNDGLMGILR